MLILGRMARTKFAVDLVAPLVARIGEARASGEAIAGNAQTAWASALRDLADASGTVSLLDIAETMSYFEELGCCCRSLTDEQYLECQSVPRAESRAEDPGEMSAALSKSCEPSLQLDGRRHWGEPYSVMP